jgi:hypothetical protein
MVGYGSAYRRGSNLTLLDVVEGGFVAGAVVELGGARRFVGRDGLSLFRACRRFRDRQIEASLVAPGRETTDRGEVGAARVGVADLSSKEFPEAAGLVGRAGEESGDASLPHGGQDLDARVRF